MRYTCRRLQTLNKSRSPDSDRGPGTSLGVGLCSQEHVKCNKGKSETTTFWPNKLEAIFIKIWVFLHSTRYAIVKPGLPTEKALIGLMFACFLFMLALKRFGFGSCCFYYHDSDYFFINLTSWWAVLTISSQERGNWTRTLGFNHQLWYSSHWLELACHFDYSESTFDLFQGFGAQLWCLKLSFSTAFIGFGRDFVILFVFDQ